VPGRGRTIAGWSAVLGLVTAAVAGYLFRDSIREAWYIHELEIGSLEEKVAAAQRLGELKSARAAPALIEALQILCAEAEGESAKPYSAFQQAMRQIGKPALLALVRAVPRGVSMISQDLDEMQSLDGAAGFYIFIHETIEIISSGKTPPEILPRESSYDFVDLQRILESLRDDPLASPELRQAAAESLKAFP
jgi:hypothetical protein